MKSRFLVFLKKRYAILKLLENYDKIVEKTEWLENESLIWFRFQDEG